MSDIILANEALPVPQPHVALNIRPATMDDLPFMDGLQKQHSKELGFFPRAQMEGYIRNGWVLVAESVASSQSSVVSEGNQLATDNRLLTTPLGYIASRDRYLKRDELGVVYQLCVRKDVQRGYIGAALLAAVFERAAYGCRLFCCWCAQDLAANRFWEAMGFSAVAFRGGSRKKVGSRQSAVGSRKDGDPLPTGHCRLPTGRVHIFWQKRIRKGDTTTPWWFPSKTEGGALRADRLVLPIPAGVHWADQMPVVVGEEPVGQAIVCRPRKKRQAIACPTSMPAKRTPVQFGRPGAVMPTPVQTAPATEIVKPPTVKHEKPKCDPKLVAAARELRDRWLEAVNADPGMLAGNGKYDVARILAGGPPPQPSPAVAGEGVRLLPAA